MRYGTIPKGLKERLAAAFGVVPYPMLDVLIAPLQARALIAAERAYVFKALGENDATSAQLAKKLALDASCLDLVLRLLASMGYVKRRAETWSLSRLGRKHFGRGAPNPFGDFVAFGAPQWEWIGRLEDVLKTGKGVEIHRSLQGSDWNLYQRAMAEGARDFAAFPTCNSGSAWGAARRCARRKQSARRISPDPTLDRAAELCDRNGALCAHRRRQAA